MEQKSPAQRIAEARARIRNIDVETAAAERDAGANQQAPIEISHPNYWAAFVLIGDGIRGAPGV